MDAPTRRGRVAPVLPIAAPADTLPASLPAVVDAIWASAERGVAERWTAWGLPTLATAGANGMPQARVVALRGVERERRTLWFHSDRRSAKFAELQADPRASVLFWSPEDAVEVRLAGRVALHVDDPVAHAAWTHASPLSRSAAQIALAPGTTLHAPTPFESLVQEGDPEMAFSHFAALAFVAEALDWLWLGPRDLRRARLTWIGHDWVGHWIVP
ncbi:MAG: pyridoxamine 5'-phosphate oxidase family protein [Burkholderiales bacterium]|nr:pyridoxamine 5'-phosphate oxidase family protein [Burkholderiales bacterium]GIK88340.1 MAG: pyridoxamine 5'-phosphate oxidase [Betaproteobacteria bacterium]